MKASHVLQKREREREREKTRNVSEHGNESNNIANITQLTHTPDRAPERVCRGFKCFHHGPSVLDVFQAALVVLAVSLVELKEAPSELGLHADIEVRRLKVSELLSTARAEVNADNEKSAAEKVPRGVGINELEQRVHLFGSEFSRLAGRLVTVRVVCPFFHNVVKHNTEALVLRLIE
ncbi:MAG TPA: hypothetical protein V6C97_13665 [Oculatellaceae cyanobacterium]